MIHILQLQKKECQRNGIPFFVLLQNVSEIHILQVVESQSFEM